MWNIVHNILREYKYSFNTISQVFLPLHIGHSSAKTIKFRTDKFSPANLSTFYEKH